jgi:hypothetical protein
MYKAIEIHAALAIHFQPLYSHLLSILGTGRRRLLQIPLLVRSGLSSNSQLCFSRGISFIINL